MGTRPQGVVIRFIEPTGRAADVWGGARSGDRFGTRDAGWL